MTDPSNSQDPKRSGRDLGTAPSVDFGRVLVPTGEVRHEGSLKGEIRIINYAALPAASAEEVRQHYADAEKAPNFKVNGFHGVALAFGTETNSVTLYMYRDDPKKIVARLEFSPEDLAKFAKAVSALADDPTVKR